MNFMPQLRKFTTAILFAVLGLALLQPLFAELSKPQLPVCCRTNGKHKCGMAAHDDSPAFRATPCAEYPRATSQGATPEAAVLPPANNLLVVAQYPQITATPRLRPAHTFARFICLRGPPARSQMLPFPMY